MIGKVAVRQEILDFTQHMEAAMRDHDPVKGDSWKHRDIHKAYRMLMEETDDLTAALASEKRGSIVYECASIACFAMMLAAVAAKAESGQEQG